MVKYAYNIMDRVTNISWKTTSGESLGGFGYEYDAAGRVVGQRGATCPVDYVYDEFGEKVSMTTYRTLSEVTGSGERGKESGAVQGDVTRWLRDEATGLITNKVYADGKGPRYDYTPDGKLATRIWALGIVTTYSYAANGSPMWSTENTPPTETRMSARLWIGKKVFALTRICESGKQ